MLTLNVNGSTFQVNAKPTDRLSDVLRDELGLYGVRVSCNEGECGACTIHIDGKPVTSCMMLAHQAEGKVIETIESLADGDKLHPVQEAFIEETGFQCGFCTPGMIMSTKSLLEENPDPTPDEVCKGLDGNICRCSAYPYIVKSALKAAEKMKEAGNE